MYLDFITFLSRTLSDFLLISLGWGLFIVMFIQIFIIALMFSRLYMIVRVANSLIVSGILTVIMYSPTSQTINGNYIVAIIAAASILFALSGDKEMTEEEKQTLKNLRMYHALRSWDDTGKINRDDTY